MAITANYNDTAINMNDIDCHFARNFNRTDLFHFSSLQEEFLLKISSWQGVFARNGVGIILNEALTYSCIWFSELTEITYDTAANSVKQDGYWKNLEIFAKPEGIHLALDIGT
jgi:hypothetical protein